MLLVTANAIDITTSTFVFDICDCNKSGKGKN